jgi:TolA-binding protein
VRTGSLVSLFFLALTSLLHAQGDENLYEAGRRAFADGLHVMAVRSFRQLVEQYPDSPWADDADFLRALAHFYLGEPGECAAVLSGFGRRYPRSPHRARSSYWLAVALLQQNRYREARESLSEQIRDYPGEAELLERSLLLRGMTEETLGLPEEARRSYRALLERSSAKGLWPEALYRLGGVELRLQSYEEALAAFSRVLVEFPDAPQAADSVFYAAEACYSLGRNREAERRYLSVLAGSPPPGQRETSLYRLARIRAASRRPAEALASVEELEAGFPNSAYAPELASLKADLYFDLGRYEEAYAQYGRVLPAAQGSRERQVVAFNRGLSALLGARPERALEPLQQAAEGPDPATTEESILRRGIALAELGRDEDAIGALKGFLEKFPASGRSRKALELLAAVYVRNGRHAEAGRAYSRLLALDPFDPHKDELQFRRGASLLAGGDESAALKDFFAVAETPASAFRAESLYNIGYVYSLRGEYARARSYFERLLELSPPQELRGRAVLAAGTSAFNAGEYREALAWFLRNTEADGEGPWSGDSWLYLGRTYYRLERLEESADAFAAAAKLLDGTPRGEESLFWEGLAQFRLDDLEGARRSFRSLTERYPSGRRIAEAYYRSGMCALLSGDPRGATAEFDRALERLGARSEEYTRSLEQEILYQRGVSLLKSGRRGEAAAAFRELSRLYPGSVLAAEGYFALADDDFRGGRYARALEGFLEVVERFPGRQAELGALYWAGASAVRAGRPEQGLELLLKYLESSPGGGLARVAEGEIREVLAARARDGDADLLSSFYRKVESSPQLPEEIRNQARYEYAAYLFPRDRGRATQILERIRASGPEEPLASQVAFLIGEDLRLSGDLDRALDVLRGITAATSGESAAAAQLSIGRVLEAKAGAGQASFDEAADEYLKAYFVYPDYAEQAQEGLYEAGRVFWELGRRERAERLFDKLAAEFPDSPWLSRLPAPR